MRRLSVDDVVHLVVPTSIYSVQTSGRTLCDLFEWFTAEMFNLTKGVAFVDTKATCLLCLMEDA